MLIGVTFAGLSRISCDKTLKRYFPAERSKCPISRVNHYFPKEFVSLFFDARHLQSASFQVIKIT